VALAPLSRQTDDMITTEWTQYAPRLHKQWAGNYMFLLRPFSNAPYFVGETDCFDRRSQQDHGGLFRPSLRTFFRSTFISNAIDTSHKGFAGAFHRVQQPKRPDRTMVFVAGDRASPAIAAEATDYWLKQVVLLICQTATTANERFLIEARVQEDLIAYYEGLVGHEITWRLSKRSRLAGQRPGNVPTAVPAILYKMCGGSNVMAAEEFFKTLEVATFFLPARRQGERTDER